MTTTVIVFLALGFFGEDLLRLGKALVRWVEKKLGV